MHSTDYRRMLAENTMRLMDRPIHCELRGIKVHACRQPFGKLLSCLTRPDALYRSATFVIRPLTIHSTALLPSKRSASRRNWRPEVEQGFPCEWLSGPIPNHPGLLRQHGASLQLHLSSPRQSHNSGSRRERFFLPQGFRSNWRSPNRRKLPPKTPRTFLPRPGGQADTRNCPLAHKLLTMVRYLKCS